MYNFHDYLVLNLLIKQIQASQLQNMKKYYTYKSNLITYLHLFNIQEFAQISLILFYSTLKCQCYINF